MIWWPRDRRPWAVLAAALLVSTFFSWDLGYSLLSIPHSRGLGLVQWGICFLLFLWGCNLAPNAIDPFVLYGGGAWAVLVSLERLNSVDRAHVAGGSPVLLGEILVVLFPAAWRIHGGLAALFAVAALAVGCRSALLAMVAMTAYFAWEERKR